MKQGLLITCEHAVNTVPDRYAALFANKQNLLSGHRGYDIGALELAREISTKLASPIFSGEATRLLVDLNRSENNRALFSDAARSLPEGERREILARYYLPYRDSVLRSLEKLVKTRGRVLHLSVHSFTPVLHGVRRMADIGLLYDPSRERESRFCVALRGELLDRMPSLGVRRNYPYRGISDGLTTFLRRRFPAESYLGIEIEINQRHPLGNPDTWARIKEIFVGSIEGVMRNG